MSILLAFSGASAATITMTYSGQSQLGWDPSIVYSRTVGTEFTVGSTALQVFRIWDFANNWGNSDTVGIWDTSGNLLTSVSFSSSDFSSNIRGKYLGGSYLADPLILNPNTTYILAAGTGGLVGRTPLMNASLGATDGGNYYTLVGALSGVSAYTFEFPTSWDAIGGQTSGLAWSSQTFEFNVIPEPSSYALFGLGAFGILMVLRRNRRA